MKEIKLDKKPEPKELSKLSYITSNLDTEYYTLINTDNLINDLVEIKHDYCGTIMEIPYQEVSKVSVCPTCFYKNGKAKQRLEDVQVKLDIETNGEYKILNSKEEMPIVTSTTELEILHTKCKQILKTTYPKLLWGNTCKQCKRLNKLVKLKDKLKEYYNGDYIVKGEFIDGNTPIELRHIHCNTDFKIEPNKIHSQELCPNCKNRVRNKRYTTDEYKEFLRDLVGEDFTVVSEYIYSTLDIKIRHEECGEVFTTTPTYFNTHHKCPICQTQRSKKNLGTAKYKEQIKRICPRFEVVEEYKNIRYPINHKHLDCGTIFKAIPANFKISPNCPHCKELRINNDSLIIKIKQQAKVLEKEGYSLLREVKTKYKRIKLKHDECGYVFELSASKFLNGEKCPKCTGQIMSKEEFETKLSETFSNNIEFLLTYTEESKKVIFSHTICGESIIGFPKGLLKLAKCPHCRKS